MQNTQENLSENVKEKKSNLKFDILAIICIIIFTISVCPISLQNDTFYTIKIGELITENGIDMKDHFSWNEDLPYTYPHWAYDVGLYHVYNAGEQVGNQIKNINFGNENINNTIQNMDFGMFAIYLSTVILACILTVLIYNVMKKLCKNRLIAFFLTMGATYLLKDFIAARAQRVSYILFVLTILFIENFLQNKKKRYLVGLVCISILLANIHVAVWPFFFVLFLPYIAEYVIASISDIHIIVKAQIVFNKLKIKLLKNEDRKEKAKQNLIIQEEKMQKVKEGTAI